ncbi:hypothetical protein EDD86DRAFT_215663 [Gorgonomyces haynaldii]|nr:hypothetical protein EDD86DRAFT_215663 [Gorgonomyces haynaldii]
MYKFIGKRLGKVRGILGMQALVVSDPQLVKQVLTDSEHFTRDPRFQDAAIDLMPFALFAMAGFGMPTILWSYFGAPKNGPKAKEIVDFFDAIVDHWWKRDARQIQDGSIDQKEWKMDVLQRLLIADDLMSAKEIRDEIIGFIYAGHEYQD